MKPLALRNKGMRFSKCVEKVNKTVMDFSEIRELSMQPPSGLLILEAADAFDAQRFTTAIERWRSWTSLYSW